MKDLGTLPESQGAPPSAIPQSPRRTKTMPGKPAARRTHRNFQRTVLSTRAEARRARRKYPEYPQNSQHDWLRDAMEELGECSRTIHNDGMPAGDMAHLRPVFRGDHTTGLHRPETGNLRQLLAHPAGPASLTRPQHRPREEQP